ncbi:MAG: TauD/TfdA family dioxygenase [Pseudomonadota bacterium]
MDDLPWTPDLDHWPVDHTVDDLTHTTDALCVTWSDGLTSEHHVLLLRENSPDATTIHPTVREMCVAPTDIDADIVIVSTSHDDNGAVSVSFSDGMTSAYHPGWLRGTAWLSNAERPATMLWHGDSLDAPPSFDGPMALEEPRVFLDWLEALRDYGITRLRGLPQKDGLLEAIVTRIGPVRESNFGRQYDLAIKDEPDSQAYTSDSLLQHIDLPTRETPHGLQFLYTRENTATGGDGIYVDGYRVAEDMRHEAPEHFHSLITDHWEYNNRASVSDYRASGPVVETDAEGHITSIRYNTFLRAPLRAPLEIQARAYRAYRAFCERAQNARYQMRIRYEPGDLVAFDNRRTLHGRSGFDTKGGARFIEGIYADRDDLHSRIRTLRRTLRLQTDSERASNMGEPA